MTAHILMAYATRRAYRETPTLPSLIQYDPGRGYWLKGTTPLVTTHEYLKGGLMTKKADQETGEDMKGT